MHMFGFREINTHARRMQAVDLHHTVHLHVAVNAEMTISSPPVAALGFGVGWCLSIKTADCGGNSGVDRVTVMPLVDGKRKEEARAHVQCSKVRTKTAHVDTSKI